MSFDPMNYNPQNNDTTIYDLLAFFFGGIWVSLKLIVSLAITASLLTFVVVFDLWQWRKKRQNAVSAQTAAAHADRTP